MSAYNDGNTKFSLSNVNKKIEECLEIVDSLDCNHKELISHGFKALQELVRLSVLKDVNEAAEFFGIKTVDLDNISIDINTLSCILPKSVALRYNVIPVKFINGSLYIAMSFLDNDAIDSISYITKTPVIPLLCGPNGLGRAIARFYND